MRSQLPDIDEAVDDGVDDDVDEGTGMELVHDVLAVGDGGVGADVQAVGNLLVDEALGILTFPSWIK